MSAFCFLISWFWDCPHSSSSASRKSKSYSFFNFLSLLRFLTEGRRKLLLFTGAYPKSSWHWWDQDVLSTPSSEVCNHTQPQSHSAPLFKVAVETEHSATVTVTLKNKCSLSKFSFPRSHQAWIHKYIKYIFKMTGTLSFTFHQQHAVWCNIRHTQAAPEAPLYPSCRVTKISLLIRCPCCSKSKYSPKECESSAAVHSAGTEVFLPHMPGTNAFHITHYIAVSSVIFTAELVLKIYIKKEDMSSSVYSKNISVKK